MERMDEGMPFLLKYENVAWYEQGKVRILDRRVFPSEVSFVECKSYGEVAQAISDMVTQSAGPYTAVGMGMALAAHQARGKTDAELLAFLKTAADALSSSRPTAANRYRKVADNCMNAAKNALAAGSDPAKAIAGETVASLNRRYAAMQAVGDRLAELIPENGAILTQCFGETIIGALIRAAETQGKRFRVFCCETRPYLQGARLTASCFAEAGFDTTVITDNMAAYVFEHEDISLYTSAADTVAMDGHIANKIGSFQLAILAKYFGVPYYVTGIPDRDKAGRSDIVIELRDPRQVLEMNGVKNTLPQVKGLYPAFDIVPPHLISGIVTDRGVYVPYTLQSYLDGGTKDFY